MKRPKKSRNGYILFARNSPYKPKVVKNKKLYNRKVKHKNGQSD